MKIYAIIITIVAVLAVIAAGIFYSQVSKISEQADTYKKSGELCQTEKTNVQNQLAQANGKLSNIQSTAGVLSSATSSFIAAGDLKVQTIGSREAADVEQKINNMTDKMDRMEAEKNWNDFKATLGFNPLFGLIRGLAQNLDRNLAQQPGNQAPLQQPVR